MRYCGGLELSDIASVLGKSTRTVSDDLEFARAWLSRALRSYRSDA
jgi:DNA-directed RNA polymerase specialized sigma24 family protein